MKKKPPTIGDYKAGRLDDAEREEVERDLRKVIQETSKKMQPIIEKHRAWKTEATTFLDFWNEGNLDLNQVEKYLTENPLSFGAVAYLVMDAIERDKKATGKRAAKARHGQPGGSNDKREKMQKAWAKGIYKSRVECAEKNHGKLGMSLSTAIKALRNTPNP